MAEVLTKQNLRSKRFLRNEMFRCTRPGAEDPTNKDWMFALYESIPVENGIELGIINANDIFRLIKPFTEHLFRYTFYYRESINGDYKLFFEVMIKTLNEHVGVCVGVFYYRSDRNPFLPERVVTKINLNLIDYLNQPFIIGIRSKLVCLPIPYPTPQLPSAPTHNPDDASSPKPLKKIFKHDRCVICLDRKPNVLFVKCRHTCMCNECEEAHPSTKCPCCRTEISEKLLI